MFLGKLLLILFIIFGPLCILASIYKIRWAKNHTGYAILKLEQKIHLTTKEGIRFLSIDKKPFGKSKNTLQFFEKILITPGKHRVEFCKFTQLFFRKVPVGTEDFRKEFLFHFDKNTTYYVTFEEKGNLKQFNIRKIS